MDFSDYLEAQLAAKKANPKEYARGVAEDAKQAEKAYAKTAEGIAEREAQKSKSGGGGGGAGIPKVGPKKPMDMKKGGVTRADGCITKGHTKGRMV